MESALIVGLLNELDRDLRWFNKNQEDLSRQFDDQFIAIKNTGVVASDSSVHALLNKLKEQNLDPAQILIRFVSKIKTIF